MACLINGVHVFFRHSSESSAPHVLALESRSFFSRLVDFVLGRRKEANWFYSVLSDYVIVKVGKHTIKAKIHSIGSKKKEINFIRLPSAGVMVVSGKSIQKPSGEEFEKIKEKGF